MNFCKICMNLFELKNNQYNCNNCNNSVQIKNNSILFHSQNKKIKNDILQEDINNLKKYDIYRSKKDSNNKEFLLFNDINFNAKNLYKK